MRNTASTRSVSRNTAATISTIPSTLLIRRMGKTSISNTAHTNLTRMMRTICTTKKRRT